MKKRILLSLMVFLIVLLCCALLYITYLSPGITGYAAKNIASGVFVAGRTQESIEKEDINFFPVKYTKNIVDYDKDIVTSKLLGIWKSEAVIDDILGVLYRKKVNVLFFNALLRPPRDKDT
jgi:hypothetical protein